MSYTPIIPLSGIGGWRFLQRTMDDQRAVFDASAQNAREMAYFAENIAEADTAAKLVADRTLLKVALGAFGLGEEIDKKAFVRTALDEGTENSEALAMRLADTRYREFSAFFGYGDARGAQVGREGFAEEVLSRYRIRAFEEAVGAVDESMRLAMNFDREIQARAGAAAGEDGFWFGLLGSPPMRTVLEGALGLPSQFASIDIEQQAKVVAERAKALIGSGDFREMSSEAARDKIIRTFLIREQIKNGPDANAQGATALTILQNGAGSGAIENLILSGL